MGNGDSPRWVALAFCDFMFKGKTPLRSNTTTVDVTTLDRYHRWLKIEKVRPWLKGSFQKRWAASSRVLTAEWNLSV